MNYIYNIAGHIKLKERRAKQYLLYDLIYLYVCIYVHMYANVQKDLKDTHQMLSGGLFWTRQALVIYIYFLPPTCVTK